MFTKTMDLGGTENVILQIIRNLKDDFQFYVLSSGGVNLKLLEEFGVTHIHIDDITTKNPIIMFKNLIKIRCVLRKYDFDIIHTHHRMAAFYVSLLKTHCEKIHTMHNTFYDKKNITKKCLNEFKIVACGETVKKNLVDYFDFKESDIRLIENGIDNNYQKEKIEQLSTIDGDIIKFCFIGRLCKQKGIDVLLKSWLLKKSKNCCLFIYGDGSLKDNVVKFASEHDDVFFEGYTNNPLNVIAHFDYLILPSRWEGLPLTLLECMSVKTVVICSDINSNKEIVINGRTGYLFKSENAEELSKLIDSACEKKLADTSETAMRLYENKYSIGKFVENYRNIYTE